MDTIIRSFNARFFQGWEATPEDQRIIILNLAKNMRAHPDYQQKYADNADEQNRNIAFNKIYNEVMAKLCRMQLDLYRLDAKDEAFKAAMQDTLKRVLNA